MATTYSKNAWRLLLRCYGYFMAYKLKVFVAFVAMAVVGLCTAGTAWLVKPAMDQIFVSRDAISLTLIPLAFVGLMTLKGFFRFIQVYYMNSTGMRVLERVRNDLYAKIVRLPMRFFQESQVGMLMSRIVNDVGLISSSLPSTVMFIRQAFTALALVGVVFYQDATLAFWALLVLPLAFYPFMHFGKKLRNLGRKNQSKVADISVLLQETFSGVKVIKAFANEAGETGRFRGENQSVTAISLKQVLMSELSSRIMELVGALGVGLVLWYGGRQVISGASTPGTFFSFMTALLFLYEPIKDLNNTNMEIQRALAGAERVFEILDSPEIVPEQGGALPFDGPFEGLSFRDVRFTYPRAGRPALDGVSLTVKPGERIAVVGPSGSGKTTLVNLIPRFYDPEEGDILLNGRPLREYTLGSLRQRIGMVSQDTFLFNATIRDNIAYAHPGYSAEEIEAAARAAFAHEFILELPDGYATKVGERGVKLSGGQKQRLTIARALLKNPPLLILDEATSALDTESERVVQLALENLMRDRTSIVIAHRLSTILSAHLILVLEQGRIVAQGRHASLLRTCPLYEKLYRMQFADERAPKP